MPRRLFDNQRYFGWLLDRYLNNNKLTNYQYLLIQMFETNYEALNELDESRANDGYDIRAEYLEDYPNDGVYLEQPANLLEALIGLCLHISDMTDGFVQDSSVGYWLWRIILNLNLGAYQDDTVGNFVNADAEIQKVFHDAMEQNYDECGNGSFFPLKHIHHRQDSRQLDLWYQMNFWIVENVRF